MEGRKPLAKVEGRRRMRHSGITVAWRGTPILADHASERKVKGLLSRLQTMSRREIERLAKG
jgi:hypothetical protein